MKYSSRCWLYRSTFIQIGKTSCAVAYYRIQSMICGHASKLSPAGDHHSRPMTMTSTTSPLWSSTYCSVFGGSINNPLALRMLIRRLLIWLPVLCAQGSGSWWCQVSIHRWYSGRGSSFTSHDNYRIKKKRKQTWSPDHLTKLQDGRGCVKNILDMETILGILLLLSLPPYVLFLFK